jgi:hypothetical protein
MKAAPRYSPVFGVHAALMLSLFVAGIAASVGEKATLRLTILRLAGTPRASVSRVREFQHCPCSRGHASSGGRSPFSQPTSRAMTDKMVTPLREREPGNAPGPFYVEKGMCIICDLPIQTAPETIKYRTSPCEGCPDHCFVGRQPETPEELDRMIEVVAGSCVEAYRYCGTDPEILRRLVEAGCREQCDALVQRGRGDVG